MAYPKNLSKLCSATLTEPSEYKCVKFETVSDEGYPNEILPYEFMGTFSFTLNW